jgi:hypothetical protein
MKRRGRWCKFVSKLELSCEIDVCVDMVTKAGDEVMSIKMVRKSY